MEQGGGFPKSKVLTIRPYSILGAILVSPYFGEFLGQGSREELKLSYHCWGNPWGSYRGYVGIIQGRHRDCTGLREQRNTTTIMENQMEKQNRN